MLISIVIPCYRSEKTIERVVEEVKTEILKREGNDYQFVLVNDCSPDGTFQVLRRLAEADSKITAVDLSRNYGQANARMAAVPYIKGDVAVCMDDDGQHPADEIYKLVDKIGEGYDLVYAKFAKQKQTFFRRVVSRVHTKLQEWTGASIKGIFNSPFLAWSSFAIQSLKEYNSPFVSAGAYLMRVTTRVANVDATQRARMEGRSGYTLKKLFSLWVTEFTNFSLVPLQISTLLGGGCLAVGAVLGAVQIIRNLIDPSLLIENTITMTLVLLIGGMILMMLGLIGVYIGKIYMTISNLPQYMVRCVVSGGVEQKVK